MSKFDGERRDLNTGEHKFGLAWPAAIWAAYFLFAVIYLAIRLAAV